MRQFFLYTRYKVWFLSFHLKVLLMKRKVSAPMIYFLIYGFVFIVVFKIVHVFINYPLTHFEANIYYFDPKAGTSIAEKKIFNQKKKETKVNKLKKIIDTILLDPVSFHLRRNQVAKVRCLEVVLFKELLVVNFNQDVLKLSIKEEQILMNSLSLSVKDSFQEIKKIQILVNGKVISEIKGAYSYKRSLFLENLLIN